MTENKMSPDQLNPTATATHLSKDDAKAHTRNRQMANVKNEAYVDAYTKCFFLSLLAWGCVQGSGLLLCLFLLVLPAWAQPYAAKMRLVEAQARKVSLTLEMAKAQ
eukprot:gnl/MRDRNA2_/MRDRNA2_30710_c0_seq1.p1 gnl/MRDRNA2_/MRDRNA2_30710_c0~~gnl/MRDRNA2_/MRDRNA2_30710_c0_seq1.p1  ORF type:complete len:106 (-),score=14.74 gnl/MRDRNA2_/MRDRNA2_30710_c0_seq1:292-609(-)